MTTKGNPVVRVRMEPELRAEYAKACEALGLGKMSDDLRAHIESVIDRYRETLKQPA